MPGPHASNDLYLVYEVMLLVTAASLILQERIKSTHLSHQGHTVLQRPRFHLLNGNLVVIIQF